MKRLLIVAVLPLLFGCSVDHGSSAPKRETASNAVPEVSRDTFALGSNLTPAGAIPERAEGASFNRGSEVFLSVNAASASTDQDIEVIWQDARGRVLNRQERHVPEGTRYVPFSSGRTSSWSSGPHRAVVVINGRKVTERPFGIL